ncbi:uncharacterized protein UV8b_03097 [Ustilaginoidea virens]|uniref:Protection of telomeres protein 1 ssDNA-binding domain-containing protein n=1 Tax=Ustilaginoidea virens TaxID=1159556 RepID=A0A8E5MGH4_USTVR|nr:uncharacterized protein UV8b_03097 [Ustilaginoidea virens]QUC18856.1 hypothetical protein UV8b_03097 [Ustilaginoidea virens]
MPDVKCGDLVIVFGAKVQCYESAFSLCTNKVTDVLIYDSTKIPKPGNDASRALRPSNRSRIGRQPNKTENEFVSILYGSINKEKVPTESEFEIMKMNSKNVKKKFSELKDVREGMFINTIAEVVKEPYDAGDKVTLWVSDYTENDQFYHHKFTGGASVGGQKTDSHGYSKKVGSWQPKSEWAGPFGKRSLQITCFDPHASAIREHNFTKGTWLFLRNLQVKLGRDLNNLEGYLREDRGVQGQKINVSEEHAVDSETTKTELKNALRRKRDYEKLRKDQLRAITAAATAGLKRPGDTGLDAGRAKMPNSKAKRNANRAAKQQAYKQKRGQQNDASSSEDMVPTGVPKDLNTQVKCENANQPTTSITDILKPVFHEATIDGDEVKIPLPFVNANHRTHARVVEFMPRKLEDFARPRTQAAAEYAVLSDAGESDSDSSCGSESEQKALPAAKSWEWRFSLKLEDASPDEQQARPSLWVAVDNQSAQMLLNLDASDLRNDDENLGQLRQRLFLLWGDLEEYQITLEDQAPVGRRRGDDRPPADSDDEGEAQSRAKAVRRQLGVSNRPFACCIRQYGVRVKEDDEGRADAGGGGRWQRMFGLFGTRICAP